MKKNSFKKSLKLNHHIVLGCLLAVFFVFRLWLAKDTSFWGDEFAWLGDVSSSFLETLRKVAKDPSPHIFLDIILMNYSSHVLLGWNVHPHIAVRFYNLIFSVLITVLPFFSKNFSWREKWSWFFLTNFSVAVLAMSVNVRPYEGLLLFGSVAVFLVLELERVKKLSGAAVVYATLLALGLWDHIYVLFPAVFAFLFIFISKLKRKEKAYLSSILGFGFIVFAWWFFIFKTHREYYSHGLSWFEVLKQFFKQSQAQWIEYAKQISGCLTNPGKRSIIITPIVFLGCIHLVKKSSKFMWFVLPTALSTIAAPILLNIKYNYFFTPRQIFTFYGIWTWLTIIGVNTIADKLEKKFKYKNTSIIIWAITILWVSIIPTINLIRDIPPYVDQPRHRLPQAFEKHLNKNQTLIVLSQCDEGVASLYIQPFALDQYFQEFYQKYYAKIPMSSRVIPWLDDPRTCFGMIPEISTDKDLLRKIENNPQAFAVLAPVNITVPKALKNLVCFTHSGESCY